MKSIILFLDDENIRTKPLRYALEDTGDYEVDYFRAPHEALKAFESDPKRYSLLIIDIMMPNFGIKELADFEIPEIQESNEGGMITGLAVLVKLREIMKNADYVIPIIILTAREDIEKHLKYLKIQPDKIIYRPVYYNDFIVGIKEVMRKQKGSK